MFKYLEAGEPVHLDRLRSTRPGIDGRREVLVATEVRLRLPTGLRFARLRDRNHAKDVAFAEAEAGNAGLQLGNGGHTVVVVRLEGVVPAAELVLLLDDVVRDGTPAVVPGLKGRWPHKFLISNSTKNNLKLIHVS